jgi:pimeloyl-ACP methyl ester carboxylesterase
MKYPLLRLAPILVLAWLVVTACGDESGNRAERPLPSPVPVRQEPEGVTLEDPAFEALPGATADFGRLGGAVYQIEMPDDWNGRLVLYMHGFEDFRPEAGVSAPDFRTYLIINGYAWGASSFSSTALIPGRSADETAALWDFFVSKYGRPEYTYATGESMGGAASHIAAERYPDRFDGALAQCGNSGHSAGAADISADNFAAAAFVAGVTQDNLDAAGGDAVDLLDEQILPALEDPALHEEYESIMIDLTGGPRAFDREGWHLDEETNWRRGRLALASGLASNEDREYRLGPTSNVSSQEFNERAIRLSANEALLRQFIDGNEVTGEIRMPLLTLHSTGDGQVPISQARIVRERAEAAGKGDLLVQRVIRDPSHCGFNNEELEANFEALVAWVEEGDKPAGEDLLVDDLRALGRTYTMAPRPGLPEADGVPGAEDRLTLSGALTLDGRAFDARFLGAVVRTNGLDTACQYTLSSVEDGRYEITVLADSESAGCGRPGSEVFLWTFVQDQRLHTTTTVPWPASGNSATFDAMFSTAEPDGVSVATAGFIGDLFLRDGERAPPGTRVEARIGETVCGVGATRRYGNYSGYILTVVGPEPVPGCEQGAEIRFFIDGEEAVQTATNGGGDDNRGAFDLIVR